MKLRIRYEDTYQTLELDAEDTQNLWVTLSLEGDDVTQEEKEDMSREAWEREFNRPDYNSWHKFNRHRGYSKAQPGEEDEDTDNAEPLMEEVADDRIFRKDEIKRGGP